MNPNPKSFTHPSARLPRAISLWLCLIIAAIFLLKLRGLSRQFTITFLSLASLAIVLRYLCQTYAVSRARPAAERNAIVVGETVSATGLSQLLRRLRAYDSVALAGQPLDAPRGALTQTRSNSPIEAPAHQPAEVFLLSGSGASITQNAILDLLKERRVVHIVPALIDAALFRYSITEVGGVPIITLSAGRLAPWQAELKRFVDLLVAAAILLICAPLMAIIALAVKLTSPGPTFFRQERLAGMVAI